MMLFVRVEREGEWALHLYAVSQILPYFFAAGHQHYARYGLYYLRSMEKLPPDVEDRFMKGEQVRRHQRGLWNAIWSDMFIETTFMRYGKGPGGLIGVTLKPKAVKNICNQVLKDLDEVRDRDFAKEKSVHKEEMPARIKADEVNREKIRRILKSWVNPLDPSRHPETVFNIQSGNIAHKKVNVLDALSIGKEQMDAFEKGWPEGFYSTIQKKVYVEE